MASVNEPPAADREGDVEVAPGIASYAADFAGPGIENLRRYVQLFPAARIGASAVDAAER